MLKQIETIARHELSITVATRRALASGALYLVAALMGGVAYVKSLQALQAQATRALSERGGDPAQVSAAVTHAAREAYERFVAFLAGTDGAGVASSLTDSLVLPAFLWGSLAFLPFLVVLTSFDVVASDLQSRALCYSVLRAPRFSILLGKLLAQTLLFVGLSVIASLALLGVAESSLGDFRVIAALPGLFRVWLTLLPYGFCYLGLATLCSSVLKQPTLALLMAFAVMMALRFIGLLAHIPEGSALGVLRPLCWLSPAQYQSGLWEAGLRGPLLSSLAYLAFGGVFVMLARRVLDGRDL